MNQTKNNHINPQGLLRFWKIDGWLRGYYVPKGKVIPKTTTEVVCNRWKFLPQTIEDFFAKTMDRSIPGTVRSILADGYISQGNKTNVLFFLLYQKMRDPLTLQSVENMRQHFSIQRSVYDIIHGLLLDPNNKLEYLGKSCLVTSEVITTPTMPGCTEIFFPITPQYCLLISANKRTVPLNDDLVNQINWLIGHAPGVEWIIFNKNYDPMPGISPKIQDDKNI